VYIVDKLTVHNYTHCIALFLTRQRNLCVTSLFDLFFILQNWSSTFPCIKYSAGQTVDRLRPRNSSRGRPIRPFVVACWILCENTQVQLLEFISRNIVAVYHHYHRFFMTGNVANNMLIKQTRHDNTMQYAALTRALTRVLQTLKH